MGTANLLRVLGDITHSQREGVSRLRRYLEEASLLPNLTTRSSPDAGDNHASAGKQTSKPDDKRRAIATFTIVCLSFVNSTQFQSSKGRKWLCISLLRTGLARLGSVCVCVRSYHLQGTIAPSLVCSPFFALMHIIVFIM